MSQFQRWVSRRTFSMEELLYLKDFLASILKRQGVAADLPGLDEGYSKNGGKEERPEDIFEIFSIRVRIDNGRFKGETVDFDVTYQLGNTVSFIIRACEKELLDTFEQGVRLSEVQCYSPRSLFNASAVVSEKQKMKRGPKRGDYYYDLIIEEPDSARQPFEMPFAEFENPSNGFQRAELEGHYGS